MHILIIPSWYKTNENPVLGSFFEEQARGLQTLGYKVGILHIGYKSFSDKSNLLKNKIDDNDLYTLQYDIKGIVPRNRYLNYFYLGIRSYKYYKEYVKISGKPDIIHAHSVFWGGIAAYYISMYTKVPFVITEHLTNFISGTLTNKTDILFSKKVFKNSSKNIVVSNSFKKELSDFLHLPIKNFSVIHNMVAPKFFIGNDKKKLVKENQIIFFTNSFLTKRKNHQLIISAFSLFLKTFPNSILYIGGEASSPESLDYKKALIKQVEELNLIDQVVFLGALSREEVKNQLNNCHVFLLASYYETFGVVLIEALAAGRPVISTDSKGPRDIINDKDGLIVNDFSPESYSKAMLQVINNYDTYNQNSISNECYQNFSEQVIMRQISNIYSSIINK